MERCRRRLTTSRAGNVKEIEEREKIRNVNLDGLWKNADIRSSCFISGNMEGTKVETRGHKLRQV